MPTAEELTDPHVTTYVPPPAAGPGICRTCHNASGGYPRCYSCNESRKEVSALDLIVPVSLTRTDQEAQLHNVLRDYKYSPDEEVRAAHRLHIAALLWRFLDRHTACIERAAGRGFDTLAIVPSKQGRVGQHPLEQSILISRTLSGMYLPLLDPGPGVIGRNASAADGFVARPEARGRSVLLVDDTMTTGAKMQSAAHALTTGGADVVAGLTLGRVIDLADPGPEAPQHVAELIQLRKEMWARQSQAGFSFDTCCLE